MKINYLLIIVFVVSTCNGQSFIWGKRGGSAETLGIGVFERPEEVYSIATDSEKNTYMLSAVGKASLNFDGVSDMTYADPNNADIALVSFACDGTFRWSRIIGGGGYEQFTRVVVDAQNNVYLGGAFGSTSQNPYPQRIDDFITFPTSPADNKILTVMKFDSSGALQWYKRPQPDNLSETEGYASRSRGFDIGLDGTLYWLLSLPSGTYADGAYAINESGRTYHVFKYDVSGNFVGGVKLDLLTNGASAEKFDRNPYSGDYFYSAETPNGSGTVWATIGGQSVTNSGVIASFNSTGNFLWKKENTIVQFGQMQFYKTAFDSDNNIYISMRLVGVSNNFFMGYNAGLNIIPATILKLNSDGSTILWATSHNRQTTDKDAIVVNGNEVGFTSNCLTSTFQWGSKTLAATTTAGYRALFARFNKETGECLSLNKVNSSQGSYDIGTALAVDASGDYIVGGQFSSSLTFDNGFMVTSAGGQTDFFISKFAVQACQPLGVKENRYAPKALLYPNPAQDFINVAVEERTEFKIYNPQGMLLRSGSIERESGNIDVGNLPSGVYFIKLGNAETIKFVKK